MESSIEELLGVKPEDIFDAPDPETDPAKAPGEVCVSSDDTTEQPPPASVKKTLGVVFVENIERLNAIQTEEELDTFVMDMLPLAKGSNTARFREKYRLMNRFLSKFLYVYDYAVGAMEKADKKKEKEELRR